MTAPFLGLAARFETQGAEKVVSDIKGIQGAAQGASEGVSALNATMEELGEEIARGLFGLASLGGIIYQAVGRLKEFGETGIEAARNTQLLNAQLTIAGHGINTLSGAADNAIRSVSSLGLSTENEVTVGLQRLTLVTGDAAWSIQHLQVAQDLAAATGMDLVTAATDLARGFHGQWQQLERLGLVTKEQVASGGAMDALIAKVKDMTKAATEGAGAWTKLGTEIKNALEDAAKTAATASGPVAKALSLFGATAALAAMGESGPLAAQIAGGSGASTLPSGMFFPSTVHDPFTAIMGGALGRGAKPPGAGVMGVGVDTRDDLEKKIDDDMQKWLKEQQKKDEESRKKERNARERLAKELDEEAARRAQAMADRARFLPATPDITTLQSGLTRAQGLTGPNALSGLGETGPTSGPMGAILNMNLAETWRKNNLPQMTVDIPNMIQQGFDAIGSAIERGVREMNSKGGGKHMFKAVSDSIVGSFGEMMSAFGKAVIAYGITLIPLHALLSNPLSAPAAIIAIGVALEALGAEFSSIVGNSSLSGGSGGSAGYAGGVGSVSGITQRSYLTPGAGTPFAAGLAFPGSPTQHVFNFFGPNDPQVQRAFQQTMQNMVRRNQTVPGIGG